MAYFCVFILAYAYKFKFQWFGIYTFGNYVIAIYPQVET